MLGYKIIKEREYNYDKKLLDTNLTEIMLLRTKIFELTGDIKITLEIWKKSRIEGITNDI